MGHNVSCSGRSPSDQSWMSCGCGDGKACASSAGTNGLLPKMVPAPRADQGSSPGHMREKGFNGLTGDTLSPQMVAEHSMQTSPSSPKSVRFRKATEEVINAESQHLSPGCCSCAPSRSAELEEPFCEADLRSASLKAEPSQSSRSRMKDRFEHAMSYAQHLQNECTDLSWLNWAVKELWPYANEAVEKLVRDEITPNLNKELKGMLYLKVASCALGEDPPELGPIRYYKKSKQLHEGIELDIGVSWDCEADVSFEVTQLAQTVGINKLSVAGELSLILKPLMPTLPIVGGIQFFMINRPELQWQMTGMAKMSHFPLISGTIQEVVAKAIAEKLVLPNRQFIHWVWGLENEIDVTAMQYPMPEMMIRVGTVRGRNLDGRDFSLFRQKTSDCLAVITIGDKTHRTSYIAATTSPEWAEDGWCDFSVYNPRQWINVTVYDADTVMDELIGELENVSIHDLMVSGDSWWPIYITEWGKKRKAGEIFIAFQTFNFKGSKDGGKGLIEDPPRPIGVAKARAMLTVQLQHLRGLPKELANGATIELTIQGETFTSVPSVYMEAEQDLVYDFHAQPIDPTVQRLAECLASKHNMRMSEIAHIAGISESNLERVLKQRPSFTTRWHHGLHILLEDPLSASLEFRLRIPGEREEYAAGRFSNAFRRSSVGSESGSSRSGIWSEEPLSIEWLFRQDDLSWKGLVSMERQKTDSEAGPAGPFDMEICLSLWGLGFRVPVEKDEGSFKKPERRKTNANGLQEVVDASMTESMTSQVGGCQHRCRKCCRRLCTRNRQRERQKEPQRVDPQQKQPQRDAV